MGCSDATEPGAAFHPQGDKVVLDAIAARSGSRSCTNRVSLLSMQSPGAQLAARICRDEKGSTRTCRLASIHPARYADCVLVHTSTPHKSLRTTAAVFTTTSLAGVQPFRCTLVSSVPSM
eukprot:2066199-Pyramimonas_sp.AAC.1